MQHWGVNIVLVRRGYHIVVSNNLTSQSFRTIKVCYSSQLVYCMFCGHCPVCCPWSFLLFSLQAMSNSLQPYGLQHTRPPCPSLSPRVCPSSWPLSQWCCPLISSSAALLSFCPQSFPTSGSFPMSQLFQSGGQNTGVSASVLPLNIQGWFPLGLIGLISLLSKGLSRVFSSTTIWKQFFGAQPSLWSTSHIHTWVLEDHSFNYTDPHPLSYLILHFWWSRDEWHPSQNHQAIQSSFCLFRKHLTIHN